jgi:hypothetical protein
MVSDNGEKVLPLFPSMEMLTLTFSEKPEKLEENFVYQGGL